MHSNEETIKYQPFVTILIPVKNVARFIKPVLESLMQQTYSADKFEVIILDNYSKDGTIDIVENFDDPRIKLVQSGVDPPQLKYNQILHKVKGDVIGFVDGDAIVDKNWLEEVIKPLAASKVAGASGIIKTWNKEKLLPRVIGYELHDRYASMPKEVKRVATMNVVYKKSVLFEVGGFNETLKTGYDVELGHVINDTGYKIILVHHVAAHHHHRDNFIAYVKQQYEYGKYAIIRNLQHKNIAKGDEVASFYIISQPFYYLVSFIIFIMWLLIDFSWQIIFVPIIILWLTYLYNSLRLSIKYKDISALLSIVLFIIRPIAWAIGCSASVPKIFFNAQIKKQPQGRPNFLKK